MFLKHFSQQKFYAYCSVIAHVYIWRVLLKQQIIDDIYAIRKALKSFERSDFHCESSFYNCSTGFPTGCCGDTTNLLGLYLKQKYDISTNYLSAKGLGNNPNLSHAWLVCDGFTIDITADQFNDIGYDVSDVIIMENSHFHTLFDNINSSALNADPLKGTAIDSVLCKVVNKIIACEEAL